MIASPLPIDATSVLFFFWNTLGSPSALVLGVYVRGHRDSIVIHAFASTNTPYFPFSGVRFGKREENFTPTLKNRKTKGESVVIRFGAVPVW